MVYGTIAKAAVPAFPHIKLAAVMDTTAVAVVASMPMWWAYFSPIAHVVLFAGGIIIGTLRGIVLAFDIIHKYRRFKKGE